MIGGSLVLSKPDVLAAAPLHPFFRQALDSLYTVHDRTHQTDPQAFAALAPRIVAVAATGEAIVPGSLLRQLPQAKVVSVFGVGYDGVDVATAVELGLPVTHTPGVLSDDVADLAMGLVLAVGRQIALAHAAFDANGLETAANIDVIPRWRGFFGSQANYRHDKVSLFRGL
jgi:lactate dehydrogenase-like 2-hydroxyacid dehydrogenase